MSAFTDRAAAFLAAYFELHPLRATDAGAHEHDGRWPDVSEAGRQTRLAFYDAWLIELRGFADGDLSLDERLDRDLLVAELEAHRFGETVLREETWDPLSW